METRGGDQNGVRRGLPNPPGANMCYINAPVQCIASLPQFAEAVLALDPAQGPAGEIHRELKRLIWPVGAPAQDAPQALLWVGGSSIELTPCRAPPWACRGSRHRPEATPRRHKTRCSTTPRMRAPVAI
eukprot:tig00020848_g14620.t1